YVRRYQTAKTDYRDGLNADKWKLQILIDELERFPAGFADQIRRRGDALAKMSTVLEGYANWFTQPPLAALPGADLGYWIYSELASGFEDLGKRVRVFADTAGGRKAEYEAELKRLEQISARVRSVRGIVDAIRSGSPADE